MSDTELVDLLAKADPVYELPGREGRRKCAICRAVGAPNTENVAHKKDCPWLIALKSRDPYGPGGKWDSRKCTVCGVVHENPQDLDVSRICKACRAKRVA